MKVNCVCITYLAKLGFATKKLNKQSLILLFYIKFLGLHVVTFIFVQPYQRIAVITLRIHSSIQDLKINTPEPNK